MTTRRPARPLRHARAVTACELLMAHQAHALSDHPPPEACRPLLDKLAGLLGKDPLPDRPFGEDIERLLTVAVDPTTT